MAVNGKGLVPRPVGRPSQYTPQLSRRICEQLMLKKPLSDIAQQEDMPSLRTMIRWLSDTKIPEFRDEYYRARRVQAELLVDEIFTIADDGANDWIPSYNKHGEQNGWKPDNEAIQRAKLRVDTRKWYAASLIPRVYGLHQNVEHDVVGDLADLLKASSNKDKGLPKPIKTVS